jgi:hypothetical protein
MPNVSIITQFFLITTLSCRNLVSELFSSCFFKKPEFNTNGSKRTSGSNTASQNGLRMSHGLQVNIYRRIYDLQMPLGLKLAAASETTSASKKCPCAVACPSRPLKRIPGEATTSKLSHEVAAVPH